MVFTRKQRQCQTSIKIDGHSTEQVHETSFLGVYIDNKLNWKKKHISYIAGKISEGIVYDNKG